MRKILLLFLIINTLVSCKSKTVPSVKDSAKKNSLVNESETLIKKFNPILKGIWVKSSYIADVIKTKSPYQSRNELSGVACMSIVLSKNDHDSTLIGYSLNNHEGSEFTLYFKPGRKSTSLKTNLPDYDNKANFYEIGCNIKGSDTALLLYHYTKDNQIIESTKYTKVANAATDTADAAWGIEYIINKKLMIGNYTMTDSTGSHVKIKFNKEGYVSGFLDCKKYYINTDFEAGPENNVDEISFDIMTKMQKDYAYKLDSDTLNLYETKHNADSTLLLFGKLKYKLVRQK